MKKLNFYLVLCVTLGLMMTGCSKDEKSSIENPDEAGYVELSFGTSLNDLVNRAVEVNKNHLNQIPTCSDATPAYARIEYSYGGMSYSTDVAIKFDGTSYFTDYTEDLKIPVADGGSTTVSLEGFIVYDGDPDDTNSEVIWIAPKSTVEGQFAGYVDNPLPFDIVVRDGTKPYIDVEVLCYDRRMANEYGYVFFDLDNTELINFCIFGNFCPPSGRHYLAAYSVNVWTVDENGNNLDELYMGLENSIEEDGGEYSSDPLCIVLPDRLGETDRYRIEIRLQDGPDYDATDGELIRTAILTDVEVRTFFDGDDNLEYFHFFEGCGQTDTPPIFDDPRDDTMVYKTCAKALNGSGVIALAAVSKTGNKLDVTVLATNTAPDMMHMQHIHGFAPSAGTQQDAVCPDDSADDNNDGIITLAEGIPFYGDVQLALTEVGGDYPTPVMGGSYIYERSFTLTSAQMANLSSLDKNVVVLHGVPGDASLPVACGELMLVQ